MPSSTYARAQQSWFDFVRSRVGEPMPGGYPVNPSETEARDAGFARGKYAAYCASLDLGRCPELEVTFAADASEFGWNDGWNFVVDALSSAGAA